MSHSLPFRNVSGETIPSFAVMRCTGSLVRAGQLVLEMQQPNEQFERLYYINGPVGIADQAFGECFLLTETTSIRRRCLASDAETPTPGDSWGAKSGSWLLYPHRAGFTILGPSLTGTLFARQHEVTIVQGTLAEKLHAGETAELSIYATSGSERMTVDVRDHMLTVNYALPSETFVVAAWFAGEWSVVSASKCPVYDPLITS